MAHAYLKTSIPAFPKPNQVKREPVAIKVYRDGREVCNLKTRLGFETYHKRKWEMRGRQGLRCCFEGFLPECPGYLRPADCSFDHEHKRGAGKQDDRIEVDGIWQNGAAHFTCNSLAGSRRIDYNRTIQAQMAGKR
jgi:hypothetical protein